MLNNIQRLLADYNLPANALVKALDPKRQDLWLAQRLLFKQLHLSSMEHQQPQLIIDWLADNQQQIRTALAKLPISVQMPRYLSNTQGQYINADQWVACEFVTAEAASKSQLSFCIAAIQQFHHCLASFKKPEFIGLNQSPWAQADRACWRQKPPQLHSLLKPLLNKLYALRQPIAQQPCQLMHADLHFDNLLIKQQQHEQQLQAQIIDFTPFWGTGEFALAIFANFIGPRQGDIEILKQFAQEADFKQLLIRAAIRMLLVMQYLQQVDAKLCQIELQAAELVIDFVSH